VHAWNATDHCRNGNGSSIDWKSDEIGSVASQHLDYARDKFHLNAFSHICEELLKIRKQASGALSKLLPKPDDIPELIGDLPDVIILAKGKKVTRRKQMNSSAHDKE
jgi:hypothetical protein